MTEVCSFQDLCGNVMAECERDALNIPAESFDQDKSRAMREGVELVCSVGSQWFAEMKPRATEKAYSKASRQIRRAVERRCREQAEEYERLKAAHPDHCGFAILPFLGMAMLNWLIGRAFTALWNWWRGNANAPALCCQFAGERVAAGCGVQFED